MSSAVRARLSYFLPQDLTLPPELKGLNLGRIRISAIPDHPFKAIQLDASNDTLTQKAVENFFHVTRQLQEEGDELRVTTKRQKVFLKASELAKYELTHYEDSGLLYFVKKAEESVVINTVCVTADWYDFPYGDWNEIDIAMINLDFMLINDDLCDWVAPSGPFQISFKSECIFEERAAAIRQFAKELTPEE